MIIYIYSKCSTCQQALRFLTQNGIQFLAKEIILTPPSLEELEKMLSFQEGDLKKLFNTSGQLYRAMKLSYKLNEMSQAQSLDLLNKHGMLVKRPFVLCDGFGLLGFKEVEWSKKLCPNHH